MTREIAGLLQRANAGAYTDFKESLLELEVKQVVVKAPELSPGPRANVPWFVRTRYVNVRAAREKKSADGQEDADSGDGPNALDIVFTREAVSGAAVDAKLSRYQSLRLSGTRQGAERVDVYEMYWADLSRLGGWVGRVLGEFYQILFHAANIGQNTVELAWLRSGARDKSRLAWLLAAQAIGEGMLGAALPLFNLALVLAILPMVAVFVSNDVIRAALCGAFAAGLLGLLLCKSAWRTKVTDTSDHNISYGRGFALTVSLLSAVVFGGWIGYAIYDVGTWLSRTLFFLILSVGGLALYVVVAIALIKRRKRASWAPYVVSFIGGATWFSLLALGFSRFPMSTGGDEIRVAMLIGEGLFLEIAAAWSLFILAGWMTCVFGLYASYFAKEEKTKAAIWTGKIGLFIPAAFFFVVNVVAWYLVYQFLLLKIVPEVLYSHSLLSGTLFEPLERISCSNLALASDCVARLIQIGTGPAFSVFLIVMLLAIGLLLAALLPSIIYESSPVWKSDEQTSAALGNWLDAGWVVLRAAGYLFVIGLLVIVPALQIIEVFHGTAFLDQYGLGETNLLSWLGGVVVGGAGFAVAFRDALSKGLTRAVGILFDVDNWLKERPIKTNPRGRILLRYMALLRHINSAGYKRIVIVSHSQGTVITADLLRFLKYDPECVGARTQNPPHIRLMTFGSPLRQLYGLRFPDLYGWARAQPGKSKGKKVMPINEAYPDRKSLFGVERWINGYRSGDYVGRFLWTPERQWFPREQPPEEGPSEFCLSAGAHTHYFDQTAIEVGRVIDSQISAADETLQGNTSLSC